MKINCLMKINCFWLLPIVILLSLTFGWVGSCWFKEDQKSVVYSVKTGDIIQGTDSHEGYFLISRDDFDISKEQINSGQFKFNAIDCSVNRLDCQTNNIGLTEANQGENDNHVWFQSYKVIGNVQVWPCKYKCN